MILYGTWCSEIGMFFQSFMFNNHFFEHAHLLRETCHKSETFNLFKVLEKDSNWHKAS
ncbi:MAG: hypothetical protein HRT35_11860 [Algicola sp.]|nr:hypothetical protein [Algicola sp.]